MNPRSVHWLEPVVVVGLIKSIPKKNLTSREPEPVQSIYDAFIPKPDGNNFLAGRHVHGHLTQSSA